MTVVLTGAGYVYPGGARLGPLDLAIEAGERVLLSGPSGSGKTTALRLLSGMAARTGWGEVSGGVQLGGEDPGALRPADRPRRLGFVGQDPKDQLVCGTVADEVGFGPECAGMEAAEVERRITAQCARAGLETLLLRDPHTLSTGQQQRLVTAAALSAGAGLLLLDEPLAHLDPDGAEALLAHLRALSDEGITVVLAEHRLARAVPWATRQIALVDGHIGYDGPPVPPPRPTSVRTLRPAGPMRVRAEGIRFDRGDRPILAGVSLALHEGDRVALLGANGAGKSTLLGCLSGRLQRSPWSDVLEVPQDPDLTLFCATVQAELAYGPTDRGLPRRDVAERVRSVAEALGLLELLGRPPHGLSRGQRLRVAVGAALTCRPAILLLDEPTAGQDPEAVERVLAAADAELGPGALLFATHDEDLARRRSTRVLRLADGALHHDQ